MREARRCSMMDPVDEEGEGYLAAMPRLRWGFSPDRGSCRKKLKEVPTAGVCRNTGGNLVDVGVLAKVLYHLDNRPLHHDPVPIGKPSPAMGEALH